MARPKEAHVALMELEQYQEVQSRPLYWKKVGGHSRFSQSCIFHMLDHFFNFL